jgi:hypothetical protein
MSRTPTVGTCHICGQQTKLSFEHVPPEAAFNDQPVLQTAFEDFINSEDPDNIKGKKQQRGLGGRTLCEKCNSQTGHWYGGAYAKWAHQAMELLLRAKGAPTLVYPFHIFPLRVLKQIVCMFFSVNSSQYQKSNTDLVRFVLNRDARELPERVRTYVYYTLSDRYRAIGATGVARGIGSEGGSIDVISEISFPPFGLVMTLGDSEPPAKDLCEITGFSKFEYKDWYVGLSMGIPVKTVYTGFPGDYRTRDETLRDAAANKLRAEGLNEE